MSDLSDVRVAHNRLQAWKDDPVLFVRECFKVEPDAWQADVLRAFPTARRQALLASKGVGKTAVLAWLCWNFLATRPNPKIAATSITGDNLKDGLWTEMDLWRSKSAFLTQQFEWTKERIFLKETPSTWWMSARTWPKSASPSQQADTLAGLHADYLLFVLDEVGGIPDAVMAAAEAGLASGIETHILMAGNPTHLEGPLYRAATTERNIWQVTSVNGDPDDPKRSPRVSVGWARDQIVKYGADSPWVLVNVFGRFPPSSINALLGPDDVTDAMKRNPSLESYQFAARILGVDVALQGDDSSVIFPRQGIASFTPVVLRSQNSMQVAGAVAHKQTEWNADAVMIDATGGWGDGVISAMPPDEPRRGSASRFGGKASNGGFFNKRAEIWWAMAQWIKDGGALPPDNDLVAELTQTTYSYRGDQILIEPKADVKAKLGRSPDKADALACTFSIPVQPRSVHSGFSLAGAVQMMQGHDYNPYAGV